MSLDWKSNSAPGRRDYEGGRRYISVLSGS